MQEAQERGREKLVQFAVSDSASGANCACEAAVEAWTLKVGAQKDSVRLRRRVECWSVASPAGAWVNCSGPVAEVLSSTFLETEGAEAPPSPAGEGGDPFATRISLDEQIGPAGDSQPRQLSVHGVGAWREKGAEPDGAGPAVLGYLDGWGCDGDGGSPYRLTVAVVGAGGKRHSFAGMRSRRPGEASQGKDQLAVFIRATAARLVVADLVGDFQLCGDLQPDGSWTGTLGKGGHGGTFHLCPTLEPLAPLGEQAPAPEPDKQVKEAAAKTKVTNKKATQVLALAPSPGPLGGPWNSEWLAGLWARPHPSWDGALQICRTPGGQAVHSLDPGAEDLEAWRRKTRIRVDFEASTSEAWQLAPGELRRLGGPGTAGPGYVIVRSARKLTLALDDSPAFSLTPVVTLSPAADAPQSKEALARPAATRALRRGPPALFPEALLGPWVRVLGSTCSHLEVRKDWTVTTNGDEKDVVRLEIFPDVVYPDCGRWYLDVARSSDVCLLWALGGCDIEALHPDPKGETSGELLVWKRPWLRGGWLCIKGAGYEESNGVYMPKEGGKGRRPRYVKTSVDGSTALGVVLEVPDDSLWVFAKGKQEIYAHPPDEAAPDSVPLGKWPAGMCLELGQAPVPDVTEWCDLQLAEAAGCLAPRNQVALSTLLPTSGTAKVEELRFSVTPRKVLQLPVGATLAISWGSALAFSGDAVVCPEQPDLASVSGAQLRMRGGPELAAAVASMKSDADGERCPVGEARAVIGARLAATWCIFAAPPPSVAAADAAEGNPLLAKTVHAILQAAQKLGVCSLGIPLLGTAGCEDGESLEAAAGALVDALCGAAYAGLEAHVLAATAAELAACLAPRPPTFAERMAAGGGQPRPAWIPASAVRAPQSKAEKAALQDVAVRGISVKQLSDLGDLAREALEKHEVIDTNKRSSTYGKRIAWEDINMYQMCDHFILPITGVAKCSYVEAVAKQPQPPVWMISHAWSTPFMNTLAMLRFHSASRCRADPYDTYYWYCTMANNQHDLSNLEEADVMKSPFARVLTSQACVGTVLLCDTLVTPMQRIWCVFEEHLTEQLRRGLVTAKQCHFLDVSVAVLSGPTVEKAPAAALLQDAMEGNWHSLSNVPGVHFPLQVATVGVQVDIRKAQATMPEDRCKILNHIAYGEASLAAPADEHPKYDELNNFVHSIFASAELYRQACERPEGCEERIRDLLQARADPNHFVRNGNTALFALVGADPALPTAAPDGLLETLLEVLLAARADPNRANSDCVTVLDCAAGLAPNVLEVLREHGAKTFEEVGPQIAEQTTIALERVISQGFAAEGLAFGGKGGGGAGSKLLPAAERSLVAAATILKSYPRAQCCIEILETPLDKLKKRGEAIRDTLQNAGAPNEFVLRWVQRGPLLRMYLSFSEGDSAAPSADAQQGRTDSSGSGGGGASSGIRALGSRLRRVFTARAGARIAPAGDGNADQADEELAWLASGGDG